MEIVYTQHARLKFELLERYGFRVSEAQVNEVILNPDSVTNDSKGRLIAQKTIGASHVLRVVYVQEAERALVITFYPGERRRYE